MLHLQGCNVLHGDLKASNVMLKSAGAESKGVTAKVADFGLSVWMDGDMTHLSQAFQGTQAYMSPELVLRGQLSKASDVYAVSVAAA